ncbi:ABC transporter substrate-binding protein [Agromyces sp. NPDC058110]|uniref:ABC transporter substrate-binding protein n=1 Tax=Agromyces sp. NPDC058110 TaxID=3346345 RepID=UPI0036DD42A2
MPRTTARRTLRTVAIGATALVALGLTACASGGAADSVEGDGNGPATLWVRAADAPLDEQLVKAWNADNPDRKIKLVAIPDAQYVQKYIQGVRSGDAPDIAVVDVANAQALVTEGLLADITSQVEGLDYADQLAPGAIDIASADGKIYGVPHQLDVSLLYYNTDLFEQAGLDPASPPTNSEEILDAARKITALGNDTYGFYFAGNCAGCNAYGTLPWVWANGGDVLDETGTQATLDDPAVAETFDLYQTMWDEGLIPPSAKDDNGATWVTSFQSNKIGMLSLGSFGVGIYGADDGPAFDVTPIVGADGDTAAFLGGDVAGVSVKAKNPGTAWDFIEWSMSEEAQTDIVATAGSLVVRSDLIDNPVTMAEPRRAKANELIATAQVPNTPKYNSVFIDATGPFLQLIRNWVFEGQGEGAIETTQSAFDERLGN